MALKTLFNDDQLRAVYMSKSQDSKCLECGLYKTCNSPKMPITGQGKQKILAIAEAPGKTEDEKNSQLEGEAGQLFRDRLVDYDLELDLDFWKTNSLACRPPKNREPKNTEMKLCRDNYLEFIDKNKPEFIWLLGDAALTSYYMGRFHDDEGSIYPTRMRGLCIPDSYSKAWILPMFHPSYALRKENDNLTQSQYDRDLNHAVRCLKRKPFVFPTYLDKIQTLTDYHEIAKLLNRLIEKPPEFLAFDYETTGLKPFNIGHKIACVSVCFDKNKAYSFPLQHPHFSVSEQSLLTEKWMRVLLNKSKKIAQNMKFEDVWSRMILNTSPLNWHWCTMITSHTLDNRREYTGLKFQAFIRWGVDDYDSDIKPFLRGVKGNEFNKVFNAPLDNLLKYSALDALFTYWLFLEQKEELPENLKKSNEFFIDGALALSDVEINGIPTNKEYYIRTDKELEEKMVKILMDVLTSKEAKLYKKERGRDLRLTADDDLRDLFFSIMKLPIIKRTPPSSRFPEGQPSVDAEVLQHLDSEISRNLTLFNKLDKVKGTYISQFIRLIKEDSKLHPSFDLHIPTTYRGSSSDPNFQNIPIRDKEAKKYTRSGIIPSKGNIILDFDYSAMEVRVLACASKDPVLLRYIEENHDLHLEEAMNIFRLDKNNVHKDLRFHAKNGFNFPEFYGSYYANCAKELWKACKELHLKTVEGKDITEHLISAKVIQSRNDFSSFENHLKRVEAEFWKKYNETRKWQERNFNFYELNGYVPQMTGFHLKGYMSRNMILNYPIQGPAFHCLLYALIHINDELQRRKMHTKIIAQIHDNVVFDCYPPEKKIVKEISQYYAVEQLKRDWKWIITPLAIEWEETRPNCDWGSKKETRSED